MRRCTISLLSAALALSAGVASAQTVPSGQSCGGLLCDMGVFGHKTAPTPEPAPPPAPAAVADQKATAPSVAPAPVAEAEPPLRKIVRKKKRIVAKPVAPAAPVVAAAAPAPVAAASPTPTPAPARSAPLPAPAAAPPSMAQQPNPAAMFQPIYQ